MMGKVYGRVRAGAQLRLACGRCLRDFDRPVDVDFAVLFEPRERTPVRGHGQQGQKDQQAKHVEVDGEDAGPTAVFFDGEELPLGEELRQELELAVPFSALCRERCAGLCARCGANLNDGPCGCAA